VATVKCHTAVGTYVKAVRERTSHLFIYPGVLTLIAEAIFAGRQITAVNSLTRVVARAEGRQKDAHL